MAELEDLDDYPSLSAVADRDRVDTAAGEFRAAAAPSAISAAGQLMFQTVDEFVEQYLVQVLWTDVTARSAIFCPEWWRHPAALVRLEALHRSFEALRQDPALGISVWLRDHADPHMAVLTDPQGPLKGCDLQRGHDDRRRVIGPLTPAPTGLIEPGD